MEVALINHTPQPLRTIYAAARTCYAPGTPGAMWEETVSDEKMVKLIEKTIGSGHMSVAEHVSFIFAISGISRACSHQLVRHRIASFSQQSQRYVAFKKEIEKVIPPQVSKQTQARELFLASVKKSYEAYQRLLEMDIPAEDARYLLPSACATNLVMTMNLRELIQSSSIRLCDRAQWEIRNLFEEIARQVNSVCPQLGKYLQPKCESLGFCDEDKSMSCGKKDTREDLGI